MSDKVEIDIENPDTPESLQAAYNRLFTSAVRTPEGDSYSLAQPYLWRSVPSFASDGTEPQPPLG
jgi:hypothetical protein